MPPGPAGTRGDAPRDPFVRHLVQHATAAHDSRREDTSGGCTDDAIVIADYGVTDGAGAYGPLAQPGGAGSIRRPNLPD